MARPATQHDERKAEIVVAALDCFARYGYEGATNKRIADAAGMKSAALIYHYFPSKEDLFRACIESVTAIDAAQQVVGELENAPLDVFFRRVGHFYLSAFKDEKLVKFLTMTFAAAQSHPELPPIMLGRVMPTFLGPTISYLMRHMAQGALRSVDPVSAVQMFFGPLFLRIMLNRIVPAANFPLPIASDDEFVEILVQTYLDGLRVRSDADDTDKTRY